LTPIHTIHHTPLPPKEAIAIAISFFIILSYCLKRICEKCGTEPGILIWIPIFNLIRLLQAGGLSGWLFPLFFVPIVNLIFAIFMWAKICQARGKTGWLVVMMFVPLLNFLFIPYLAFSE
jgi:hypothetical protein